MLFSRLRSLEEEEMFSRLFPILCKLGTNNSTQNLLKFAVIKRGGERTHTLIYYGFLNPRNDQVAILLLLTSFVHLSITDKEVIGEIVKKETSLQIR